jgi:branched-chain amino acid transport system substrate-binding protein
MALSRGALYGILIVVVILVIAAAYFLTLPPAPTPTTPVATPTATTPTVTTPTVTTPTATTPVVKEVKIGVILPLSGKLAETGADLKKGIEFAVEKINAAGGIKNLGGAKLVVVWGDSAGDPATGAAEAERLIKEEKVVALMGCYQSAVTKTASEVAESYKVPFLNPDSSSPTLTERGYKWFFRTTAHDGTFAVQHVEFINYLNKTYGGLKTVAIINEDTEWGASTAKAWKELFSAAGYKIVAEVSYHAATVTSLDSEVEKLKAANPDVLLIAAYTNDGILLVRTMKAKNFAPKVALAQDSGFIDPAYVKQIGKDGYYFLSREVFNWDLLEKIPELKKVNDEYSAKYGISLNGNSARDYTGTWVLYWAIEEAAKVASPTDLEAFRKAIRDALAKMEVSPDKIIMPWAGVKFDEKGQNVLARGIIVQMSPDDGKYHTVYPIEVATKPIIFPFPSWEKR